MQQCDKIEVVLNRIVITDFLIAAIALVDRIEQDVQRKRRRTGQFNPMTDFESAIARRIVDGKNLDLVVAGQADWDTRQNTFNGPLGVIGDHKNEHSRFFLASHTRIPLLLKITASNPWYFSPHANANLQYVMIDEFGAIAKKFFCERSTNLQEPSR